MSAAKSKIEELARLVGADLPSEYLDFLRIRNGWSGPFEVDGYLIIHSVEDSIEIAKIPLESLPGYFVFGSNGGGLYFAFDMQQNAKPVIAVDPFLNREEQVQVADSFRDFIRRAQLDKEGTSDSLSE